MVQLASVEYYKYFFSSLQLSTNMVQITSVEYKYSSVHSVVSWVGGRFRDLSVELGWIQMYGDFFVKLEYKYGLVYFGWVQI